MAHKPSYSWEWLNCHWLYFPLPPELLVTHQSSLFGFSLSFFSNLSFPNFPNFPNFLFNSLCFFGFSPPFLLLILLVISLMVKTFVRPVTQHVPSQAHCILCCIELDVTVRCADNKQDLCFLSQHKYRWEEWVWPVLQTLWPSGVCFHRKDMHRWQQYH